MFQQVSEGLSLVLLQLLEVGGIMPPPQKIEAAHMAASLLPLLVAKHPPLAPDCLRHIANCVLTSHNKLHYIGEQCVALSSRTGDKNNNIL